MWAQITVVAILLIGTVSCYPWRVVGGTDTTIEEYPFVVSLRGFTGSHSCGASILSDSWVLTAAHCVYGRSASDINIQYSTTEISANGPNVGYVKRIIIHEKYVQGGNYPNDIALLEMKDKFIFNNRTLAPVNLPKKNFEISQTNEGAPGILVGWGLNATGGYIQKTLQKVDLKIFSDAECQNRHNNVTTVDHICGGVNEGGKGQCSGDSGGPLLLDKTTQLGIVSWSIKPCTIHPYPGVYTKVSHFIDWIFSNIS